METQLYTGPILLGAGGTGGHMFPAQALGEELRRRGHQILLITDARGQRYTADFPADRIIEIKAANPNAGGVLGKVSAAMALSGGLGQALKEIKNAKPIAAIGFGGYPSLPALQGAAIRKIPYAVHEQNSQLGRSNRFLSRGAQFLAHAFPVLTGVPASLKTPRKEVGNPVRDDVKALVGVSDYVAPETGKTFRLLITGGSQGASLFSDVPIEAISALPNHLRQSLEIEHQVRSEDEERVNEAYHALGIKAETAPFFGDLPRRLANAHLIIARSGASTVTEISALGRPAIFVPLASAMDDHQTMNARVLSEADAAILMPEKEFKSGALRGELENLMTGEARLTRLANNASGRVKIDAAATLADLVEEMIEKR